MKKDPFALLKPQERRCPSCDAKVSRTAQTCLMCGAELPPPPPRRTERFAQVIRDAASVGRGQTCPSCGASVAHRAKRCMMCGAELPSRRRKRREMTESPSIAPSVGDERACPFCGASVARTAKQCLMCGALLEVAAPPESRESEPTDLAAAGPEPDDEGRRCPACGAPVAGTAEVCLMCGADLKGEGISQAEPPPLAPPTRWRRVLPVVWAVLKLPLAVLLAAAILGGIGLVVINQPWKQVAGLEVSPLITPLVTPLGAETRAAPTLSPSATPTDSPTPTSTSTSTPTLTPTFTPSATPTWTPTPVVVITYTVQANDSWISVADQFRVDAVDLARYNGRSVDDFLRIDEVLRIPPVGGVLPPTSVEHVVARGDRLESLARRYGVSVEAILIANGITIDYVLIVGETLIIPFGTPTPPPTVTPTPTDTATPSATPTATVTPWPDTPTPSGGYPRPVLLTPPDGEVIENGDTVLLTWASVGVLAEDEWYVVRLRLPGDVEQSEGEWVKATSWRVPVELHPAEEDAGEAIFWQVVVARRGETSSDGAPRVDLLSPLSEMRTFYWR